eukprot:1821361-Rhodomonas_salina.2
MGYARVWVPRVPREYPGTPFSQQQNSYWSTTCTTVRPPMWLCFWEKRELVLLCTRVAFSIQDGLQLALSGLVEEIRAAYSKLGRAGTRGNTV